MDPNEFYNRMIYQANRSAQQQQSDAITLLHKEQMNILNKRIEACTAKKSSQPAHERFANCEIVDAEFEVIPDMPTELE
jgi:hypothetical protein